MGPRRDFAYHHLVSTPRVAAVAAGVLMAWPFATFGQQAASSASPAPAAVSQPDPRIRYMGTFHYIGGDREEALRLDAVEHSAQALNFLIRGIGRSRLRSGTIIARQVTLRWTPGRMEVVYADPPDHYRSRDDGTTGMDTGPGGSEMRVWHRFENGNLRERRWTDEGARENFYMLSPDGNGLTVEVTMSSTRLPCRRAIASAITSNPLRSTDRYASSARVTSVPWARVRPSSSSDLNRTMSSSTACLRSAPKSDASASPIAPAGGL